MGRRIRGSSELEDSPEDVGLQKGGLAFRPAFGFVVWLSAVLTLNLIFRNSGGIGRRVGLPRDLVLGSFLGLVLLLNLPSGLKRKPLPGSLRFLDRWLLAVLALSGIGICSCWSTAAEPDRWSMSGPICQAIALVTSLVCLLRWLDRDYPGGLAGIWRRASSGETAKAAVVERESAL